MVKFLINLVQKRNILRVEAPEWYPIKNKYNDMSEEGVNEVVEEEEWKIPKKSFKKNYSINKDNVSNTRCDRNSYDTLSDEDVNSKKSSEKYYRE